MQSAGQHLTTQTRHALAHQKARTRVERIWPSECVLACAESDQPCASRREGYNREWRGAKTHEGAEAYGIDGYGDAHAALGAKCDAVCLRLACLLTRPFSVGVVTALYATKTKYTHE